MADVLHVRGRILLGPDDEEVGEEWVAEGRFTFERSPTATSASCLLRDAGGSTRRAPETVVE